MKRIVHVVLTLILSATVAFTQTSTVTQSAGDIKNPIAGGLRIYSGTAIPAGGTAGAGWKFSSTANFGLFFGSGAPTLSAARGSLYLRSDGTPYYNADGATTWTAVGGGAGGTPGGADTQVQFNDGGAFGGDAGLTYDKTTDTLTANSSTIALSVVSGQIASASAGGSGAPALLFTGAPHTGSATLSLPLVYLQNGAATPSTTLNTDGTYFGINGTGGTAWDLMNLMDDGVSMFKVSKAGVITAAGGTALTQTNTVAGITNKTFTSPVLGAATATSLTSGVIDVPGSGAMTASVGLRIGGASAQTGVSGKSDGTDLVLVASGGQFKLRLNQATAAPDMAYGVKLGSGAGTANTNVVGDEANVLQLGLDAAGVTDQAFKGPDRITSDGVGGNLTIAGGRNRGASAGGSVIFQTSPAAGAGVTGTLTTRLTIDGNGIATFAIPPKVPSYTVATLPATAATGAVVGAHAYVTDATAPTYLGALTGGGAVVCPVFYNGAAWVSH